MSRLATTTRRSRQTASQEHPAARLPSYAPQLTAFHDEFAGELRTLLSRLPIRPGSRVLDVACGDGRYAAWLAGRAGSNGSVTAIDASRAWLAIAAKTLRSRAVSNVILRRADARKLPFEDKSFDFVWCAQSLYSLPDLMQCLREMVRVLCPGGSLAVLEDDTLHHILLPWPVDLELEVRAAELEGFRSEAAEPARYYIGRWASRLLQRVGLRRIHEQALAATRQAPLSPAGRQFFGEYLTGLRRLVSPRLSPSIRRRFEQLVDPASRRYLLDQRDFVAVCLDRVVWGTRPAHLASR